MVKYIYTGYSKCGTTTMAEVFRILGFKVCDFQETHLDCGDAWLRFFKDDSLDSEGRIRILREALKNFDVCMDTPCFLYWREILEAFPEAKCVHFERYEDAWTKSIQNQIVANRSFFSWHLPDWVNWVLFKTGLAAPHWDVLMQVRYTVGHFGFKP